MRMSCIYGPRQMGTEDQGWVAHFLIRALQGEPIRIYGDGCQVRDVLDIGDAVEAYAGGLAAHRARCRAAPSISAAARRTRSASGSSIAHIEDLVGRPVETVFSDWRAGDQRYYVSDTRLAARELGLRPPVPWRRGVAALARWLAGGARPAGPADAACREPRRRCREASRHARPPQAGSRAEPTWRSRVGVGRPALESADLRRVLMTADAVGGVWPYALDLARGPRAARGRDARSPCWARVHRPTRQRPPARCRPRRSWRRACRSTGRPQTPDEVEEARCGARRGSPTEREPDIVHLNSPALAAERRFPAPVVVGCHSCVATWWEAVRSGPLPEDFVWRAELVAAGYRAADALVAPTAAFADATAPDLWPARRAERGPQRPLRRAPRTSRRPAGAPSSSRPAGCGTRARTSRPSIAPPRACRVPVVAAGPLEGPNGARIALRHVEALGRLSEATIARLAQRPRRSSSRRPATSPSVSRCSRRRRPAARSCSPTSRPSASCGTAPPSSSRRTTTRRIAACDRAGHRATPTLRDALGRRPRASGRAAYTVEAMAAGMLDIYRSLLPAAGMPAIRRRPRHEVRLFHPFARLLLEPRQRAFPARRAARADATRARGRRLRARRAPGASRTFCRDHGEAGLDAYRERYPELLSRRSRPTRISTCHCPTPTWSSSTSGTSLRSSRRSARLRRRGARFTLLFHDTHHRAVSDPDAIRAFDLDGYDGVLAFGETLAEVYRRWGWGRPGLRLARGRRYAALPSARGGGASGAASSGSATGATASAARSSRPFCFAPAEARGPVRSTSTACAIPTHALDMLEALRRDLPRLAPERPSAGGLRPPSRHGARAAPLLRRPCCPASRRSASSRRSPAASRWSPRPGRDSEGLFRPGQDFLVAQDGAEMERHLRALRDDPDLRRALVGERARDRSAAAIPARTAPTSSSPFSPALGAGAPLEMSA